jgi:hypothetical protein
VGKDLMVLHPRFRSQECERSVNIGRDGGNGAEHSERNPLFASGQECTAQQAAGSEMRESVQFPPNAT